MLLNSNQECVCGRLFENAGAFTRHKKICSKGRKHLASVLQHAKETHHRKKRRIDSEGTFAGEPPSMSLDPSGVVDGTHVVYDFTRLAHCVATVATSIINEPSESRSGQASTSTSNSGVENSGLNEPEVRTPFSLIHE